MKALDQSTAVEIRDSFLKGERSARQIVQEQLGIIKGREKHVDAFLQVTEDHAFARAEELDRRRAAGKDTGLLAAVPVAVKDNICMEGVRTTCASRMLENFVPPYSAHVVERLEAEGAIIVGKTNLDEFAMGSSTENSGFKTTKNPWDRSRIPGGSSGGSAAAVASRMVPLALGSDTGGSIRQPAALCGVVGLKPTYGRVSRYGLVAFASSLDQVGPFGRNAEDMALMLEVISEPDRRDSTCTNGRIGDCMGKLGEDVSGLTFGLPKEFYPDYGMDDEVADAMDEARKVYEKMGVRFKEVSLPHSRIELQEGRLSSYAVACYYILCTAEASSNLARYDGMKYGHRSPEEGGLVETYARTRSEGFGDEVKRRIMLGTHVLSSGYYDAYYLKAGRVRQLIAEDFERIWDEVDVLMAPTTPSAAFKIGEKVDDPLEMYLNDVFTISCNLAGICGVSAPCGFTSQNLPMGMQLMADKWEEIRLLNALQAYQRETDWHLQMPDWKGS